jgi:hypothetical protein
MAGVAFADNAIADGDGLAPVADNGLALSSVACNVSTSDTALIAISRNGSATGTNVFANNSQVTVSVLSITGTGLSATVPASPGNQITLPSNWTALTNNTMSNAVSATVSINSAAAGPGTGSITFRATGLNTSGDTINRDDAMPVTWTTGSCAPPNTAPSVSVTGVTDGGSYELGGVPAANCSVTDTEDGDSTFAATLSLITGPQTGYGLGSQTASCSYTDGGGLSDSASATYSIVDTGDPIITDLGPTAGPNGANGWYTGEVTNQFQASDDGAGFESPLTNPHTFTQSSGTNEGSAVTIASGTVTDVAGNEGASINSAAFMIDLSNPYNIAIVGGPAAGGSYVFGSVPAAPTCTADDDISEVAGCIVSGYSAAVGSHTLTATATDNAGRTATATRSYTVLAWTTFGFYSPVDMSTAAGTVINTIKGGQTVPLKFEVFAGSNELTSTSAIKGFAAREQSCAALQPVDSDAIEIFSTGGTSLRYDSTAGQFIQNWQTPKTTGKCYAATVTFQDLSTITAYFQTK